MQTPSSANSVPWLTEHEDAAWRSFLALSRGMERAIDRQLQRDSELSSSEYHVLVPLSESQDGSLPSRELLRYLDWERSRLSHMLSRMEKRGMVCRKPSPQDARGLIVEITEHGRQVINGAAPSHLTMVREAFMDNLSTEEMQALVNMADKVIPRLENMNLI
ncbi:MarR family transcriptional regulator [Kocuria sp. WRN011]|uniref:MarR family winged helix-turn-helix transcriptional regulator n=1 Tax=Kocuria TaxID=57493 RepID=UPI000BAFFCD5|nr:MarR family transcriptional regulator [Kocuria sp. WRN011]PBB09712.1 MarR family transcriptional regulator [Kocuria sp. WRN011]